MLEGRIVVVTGSAQGIGKHAAKTFADQKAKVVVADSNEELAKKTAGEIGQHAETFAVRVDVRNEASVNGMIERVIYPRNTVSPGQSENFSVEQIAMPPQISKQMTFAAIAETHLCHFHPPGVLTTTS